MTLVFTSTLNSDFSLITTLLYTFIKTCIFECHKSGSDFVFDRVLLIKCKILNIFQKAFLECFLTVVIHEMWIVILIVDLFEVLT